MQIKILLHMNIYVGNLDYGIDEEDLRGFFEDYGAVKSAKVISDKFSGKSKGFGFVEMDNDDEAKSAMEELNGATVEDRKITVNEARPKKDNNSRK